MLGGKGADKENEFTKKEDLFEHVKYLLGKCGMLVSVAQILIYEMKRVYLYVMKGIEFFSRFTSPAVFGFLHSEIRMAVHTYRLPTELP